ncbi:nuclear transport factor 2 family protein [Dactylosporangium sp. CS-033363]|uniref:nuclear transport factor 2 family protein n=1 Tax=Dactylosporangium sp. CS-033363 TaxID=3239935 RepID=UPI003D92E310
MVEEAINAWHDAVNRRDLDAAQAAVTDPVDVSGPRGAGPIPAADFAGWIIRSGIRLSPLSYHPAGPGAMVVEQDARWNDDGEPARVATLFRVRDGRIALAHRFASLHEALAAAQQ